MTTSFDWKDHFELRDGLTYRVGQNRPCESYARGSHGYINVTLAHEGKQKQVLLHRLKFYLKHGWWPAIVDHRDENKGNYSLSNLRAATKQQNMQNITHSSRLPRGVSFFPKLKSKPYLAQAYARGERKYLGYFSSPQEASLAVEDVLREAHGEFYREQGQRC